MVKIEGTKKKVYLTPKVKKRISRSLSKIGSVEIPCQSDKILSNINSVEGRLTPEYVGINKHVSEEVVHYNTVTSSKEYENNL